jgi:16S rRNA (adenine1518-N6/adenine1519-N6)-dimethyltransferase
MSGFSSIPALDAERLLRKYGLKPDKSLGQNFLQDPEALETIAVAADLGGDDTALEIGPGLGSLTRYLATVARRVVAVELDERMLPPLHTTLAGFRNVEIVQGDILKLEPARLVGQDGYVVAANIPYYITSAVTRHLLDRSPRGGKGVRPRRMVLTVQKEVARRICADPGALSLLALSVQIYGGPHIAATLPASAFYPVPKVDSACLRVDMYSEPLVSPDLTDWFFRAARAGFSQKRKTLRNSLSGGLRLSTSEAESLLEGAGISPQRRAETVSIEEWGRLAANLRTRVS